MIPLLRVRLVRVEDEGQIFFSDTIVSLFLDMVARALITNESTTIRQILAQIEGEYLYDANELNWPEDAVQ
jgi:hypothetical protein